MPVVDHPPVTVWVDRPNPEVAIERVSAASAVQLPGGQYAMISYPMTGLEAEHVAVIPLTDQYGRRVEPDVMYVPHGTLVRPVKVDITITPH